MSEVSRILDSSEQNDPRVAAEILPLVYEELRNLAAAKLALENPGHSLQPTALVHEAYLRLLGAEPEKPWSNRAHFFSAAAEAMRRILIESARRRKRLKRGGDRQRIPLQDVPVPADESEQLIALDEALKRLAGEDPIAARVVELKQFAGLDHEQVAAALEMTVYRVRQKWTYARAWLTDALQQDRG